MASYIAKKVGNKITKGVLENHLASIEPQDPLYTHDVSDPKKRTRRELPPGLSQKDAQVLKKVRKRAHRLDKAINLCGFRIGVSFFLGLIPVLGDLLNMILMHNLIVKKAKQVDLPDWLIAQMIFNNLVASGVGLVPIAGDIVAGVWKANSRNCHLLEEFLALRGQQSGGGGGLPSAPSSRPAASSSSPSTPPHGNAAYNDNAPPLPPREGAAAQKQSWFGGGQPRAQDQGLPGPGGAKR